MITDDYIDFSKSMMSENAIRFRAKGMTERYIAEKFRINRKTVHGWYSGTISVPVWARYAIRDVWIEVDIFGPKGAGATIRFEKRFAQRIRKDGQIFKCIKKDVPGHILSVR